MRHIQNFLCEDREQREYREAKARFFRRLAVLGLILTALLAVLASY